MASVENQSSMGTTNSYIKIEFNDQGTKLLSDITNANKGKQIGIFLGGRLISMPLVQDQVTDGTAIIAGNFTADEVAKIATQLNAEAGK